MPIILLSWDLVFHRLAAMMDSITRADDGSLKTLVNRHTNYINASVMASNIVNGL